MCVAVGSLPSLNDRTGRVKGRCQGAQAARDRAPAVFSGRAASHPGPIVGGGLVVPGPIVGGGPVVCVVVGFLVVVVCLFVVVV